MGLVTTVLYGYKPPLEDENVLLLIGAIVSILSVTGCYFGYRFHCDIEGKINIITKNINLEQIPLQNSGRLIIVLLVLSTIIGFAFGTELLSSYMETPPNQMPLKIYPP